MALYITYNLFAKETGAMAMVIIYLHIAFRRFIFCVVHVEDTDVENYVFQYHLHQGICTCKMEKPSYELKSVNIMCKNDFIYIECQIHY